MEDGMASGVSPMDRVKLLSEALLSREIQGELAVRVQSVYQASIELKQEMVATHAETIVRMAWVLYRCMKRGGKVLFCGVGGSAAVAQHFAAELLVRLRPHIERDPLPALSLVLDPSSVTAFADGEGLAPYFERMTRALGRPGDVLVGLMAESSPSVVAALRVGRDTGLVTLGFLGGVADPWAVDACDIAVVSAPAVTTRTEEAHLTAGHAMLELVEDLLLDRIWGP